jgi:hypothetical protein
LDVKGCAWSQVDDKAMDTSKVEVAVYRMAGTSDMVHVCDMYTPSRCRGDALCAMGWTGYLTGSTIDG